MSQNEHPLKEEELRLKNNLVIESFGGRILSFKPFALYHRDLDQIVVQIRDCSFTEIEIGEMLVLMEDNYPEKEEDMPVGFIIKSARDYCTRLGLLHRGWVNLHEVLGSLLGEPYCYEEGDISVARDVLIQSRIVNLELK